ncbi:Beta-galactosidase C-terminal domain [Kibdelosporangium aridum]|uniref:Beta-galactosidase C-terminal domain n=1 Tax=Kibdelosporangium aridum TaxID=2030 RepID=UPI0035ECE449
MVSPCDLPRDAEVIERLGTNDRYLFIINHTDADALAPIAEQATELLTGESVAGQIKVPAGGVRVVVQPLR